MSKTVIEKRDELIDLLNKYGFGITASDKDYTRMIYYDRNEDILADDSVHVVEEKIKIEFDLDDMSFKAKSFLTDENTTAVTGEVSMAGRFPTVEELEDTLVNEYGLEQIVN